MAKIVFIDISEVLTFRGAAIKGGRKVVESDLGLLKDAAIVCENGKIEWIGPRQRLSAVKAEEISLQNRAVLPAFLECHTHLAFAGDRSEEFEWRVKGMSYQEIAAKGGGIASTVKATRAASDADLKALMQKRSQRFLEQGVTTLEIKSGYGLDEKSEMRLLALAGELKGPRIVKTFLGPHSRAPEFSSVDEYFEHVLNVILPKVAAAKLADRVDIFIEKGFFSAEQAKKYFAKAKALGLSITAHVEQLSHSGGGAAALEFGAASIDHAVEITADEIKKLGASKTAAVLLPASDFYLKMEYPNARALIDAGACVALSTDFNPGTSPTQDLSLVGVLARLEMKMTLPEVLSAWTVGAAHALEMQTKLGSLEEGKLCDFITLDGNYSDLFYSVGQHPVAQVWREGEKINEKNEKKF